MLVSVLLFSVFVMYLMLFGALIIGYMLMVDVLHYLDTKDKTVLPWVYLKLFLITLVIIIYFVFYTV